MRRANLDRIDTITFDPHTPTQVNAMLDVKFIHNGKDILVGSNTGEPVIVNVATKDVVQVLVHSQAKAVTPINAYWSSFINDRHLLATGDRDMGQETVVKLWQANPPASWPRKILSLPAKVVNSSTWWWLVHAFLFSLILRYVLASWLHWDETLAAVVRLIGTVGEALSKWASDDRAVKPPTSRWFR
ncbi:hypothetical protein V5O48_001837 [Marasmius crinis-equi]|uniref:Uncharacterized protein n=1 Tax=Marasmius crinis-equi TaxID=585013 RepID=A0ABR3FXI7_9AGAR